MNPAEQQLHLLRNLRDLHIPDENLWWPPAPGWWVVAVLLALLLAGLSAVAFRYCLNRFFPFLNPTERKTPQTRLKSCFEQWQADGDNSRYNQTVNHILKETAITYAGRASVAGLSGQLWINWMERATDVRFSADAKTLLSKGIYQRNPPAPSTQSHAEITAWLLRYLQTAQSTPGTDNA